MPSGAAAPGAPRWWRFLPPDACTQSRGAGAITEAAAKGRGVLARSLREAREAVGAARAAALLRSAEAAAGRGFGRPFRLLLVSAQQPRSLVDALTVGFAIAGFTLAVRSVDGVLALQGLLADPGTDFFDDLDLTLFSFPDEGEGGTPPLVEALAASVATRSLAPAAVADFVATGEARVDPAERRDVEILRIACGGDAVLDRRFAASFGAILTAAAADRLADAAAGFAARLKGLAPKLLVTDLDGTLWDGVLGESGGGDADPSLHEAYAAALAALRDRGFVLAAASRSDAADVRAVFAANPGWALRHDDIAVFAVGWQDKAALVAAVLDRAGLASEHAVFVDDDPVNCAKVAARFPAMDVRLFGGDPDRFAAGLAADPLLQGGPPEGARRTARYRLKAEVDASRAGASDIAAFLRSLRTELTVRPLDAGLLPRAAELAARVNQFVFTAERPNALRLSARASGLDFMIRLDDAFGAHGLVGLVLATERDGEARIDNLFLSCRALERGVDGAMLAVLGRSAADRGLSRIVGRIEALPRNEPARDCLSRHGFLLEGSDWIYDLRDGGAARLAEAGTDAIVIRRSADSGKGSS